MSEKILIAKITSAHGIQGDVKMAIYADDPFEIEEMRVFDKNNQAFKVKIKSGGSVKKTKSDDYIVVAKIDLIKDRNDAQRLSGTELYANRDDFKKLEEDEFFITDLVGLDVYLQDELIGKILDIHDFGSGTVIEIKFGDKKYADKFQGIDIFPFKDEFFPVVDLDKGRVEIEMPEINEVKGG